MAGHTHALLNGDQILKRLEAGEIFRPETWARASLRLDGYDLRIASDRMVVPERPGEEPTLVYQKGEHRTQPIRLAPGDSALVSSAERLAMPADLAGNIGGKFIQSTRGLLVLTGFMLDPAYGMRVTDEGLKPTEDSRLHFLLACIGGDTVELQVGEVVAAVQFFHVEPSTAGTPLGSPGGRVLEERFFDPKAPARPLVVFSAIRQARQEAARIDERLKTLEESTKRRLDELDGKLDRQMDDLDRRLEITEGGSKQVTMFGVFLVSVTLLGAALVAVVTTITNFETGSDGERAVAIAAMCVACIVIVVFTWWLAGKIASSLNPTSANKAGQPHERTRQA